MGFIVLEGLDGAGKSTQVRFIEKYFGERNIRTQFMHFPRADAPFWGDLISRFLRGELGDMEAVDPYLVSLIYAGDRNDAASLLNDWMDKGYVVIADRYLYSNIAFQCAKLKDSKERDHLAKWIKAFEYDYNRIPLPDLNLFLDVPFSFTRRNLAKGRQGKDREYLEGGTDIHEADLDFQQKVREMYLWQVRENEDFQMIDCRTSTGEMLQPEAISLQLIERIQKTLNI